MNTGCKENVWTGALEERDLKKKGRGSLKSFQTR